MSERQEQKRTMTDMLETLWQPLKATRKEAHEYEDDDELTILTWKPERFHCGHDRRELLRRAVVALDSFESMTWLPLWLKSVYYIQYAQVLEEANWLIAPGQDSESREPWNTYMDLQTAPIVESIKICRKAWDVIHEQSLAGPKPLDKTPWNVFHQAMLGQPYSSATWYTWDDVLRGTERLQKDVLMRAEAEAETETRLRVD